MRTWPSARRLFRMSMTQAGGRTVRIPARLFGWCWTNSPCPVTRTTVLWNRTVPASKLIDVSQSGARSSPMPQPCRHGTSAMSTGSHRFAFSEAWKTPSTPVNACGVDHESFLPLPGTEALDLPHRVLVERITPNDEAEDPDSTPFTYDARAAVAIARLDDHPVCCRDTYVTDPPLTERTREVAVPRVAILPLGPSGLARFVHLFEPH